ncbi:alpha/beta fold hydrolase [Kutzneria buriramensis]|uniref:Pimeloyl-ACP methyl ester carboxylesterase n=1 Tax=Kutzneria buriramensis TaxID=1045776 RepID=A0A3E0HEX1_9PSEU|nr:alpha/beta hydrolase [Kutzneria buriramensis]REH43757.1 pimeloyl-ACP methyl ester carboxylesterase [Kutzneria buriramensis]
MRGERLNDGLSVAAVGQGEPLVTLPGLGTGADLSVKVPSTTAFFANILAAGYKRRVHVINRPVTVPANTTLPDLAGWHAEALRGRFNGPVDVMGTSGGGATALQLAIDHPDVVRRLILCTIASRPGDHGRERLLNLIRAEQRGRRDPWAASGLVTRGPLRLLTFAAYAFGARGKRAQGETSLVEAIQDWDVTDRLGEVSAPTLLIAGGRDEIIPAEFARATAAGIAQAQLLMIERGDHVTTMFDRRVSPAIREFLNG